MRARWLAVLGVLSYSVYLFHQAVSGLLHSAVFQRPPTIDSFASALLTLLALAVTLAIAFATRLAVERPAMAMAS
jgi:peptidoglycan/LPS O-acetylase OafA/YrhL